MRSELDSLSAGIDDFSSDLSSVFTHEESTKLESAAMEWSSVPEALVTTIAEEIITVLTRYRPIVLELI